VLVRVVSAAFVLIAAACAGASDGNRAAVIPTAPSLPAVFTLSGRAFEHQDGTQRPVEDVRMDLWIERGWSGYSHSWKTGEYVATDGTGRYRAHDIPSSYVTVRAWKSGYVQPCAVTLEVLRESQVDVELAAVANLVSTNPPQLAMTGPVFAGIVFETTAAGRRPIAGVSIVADVPLERFIADTVSDLTGHFALCNLPVSGGTLYVNKTGFEGLEVRYPGAPTEIELKRAAR
jgi:hypothetical protein